MLVTWFGTVYKLTKQQWLNYVDHRYNGGTLAVSHFGKALGPATDVTDWTSVDAQLVRADLLAAMRKG